MIKFICFERYSQGMTDLLKSVQEWLLLTFFICLPTQLSFIRFIISTYIYTMFPLYPIDFYNVVKTIPYNGNRISHTTLYNATCFHQFSINRLCLYDFLFGNQLCCFVNQLDIREKFSKVKKNTPDNFRNCRNYYFSHPTFICKVI